VSRVKGIHRLFEEFNQATGQARIILFKNSEATKVKSFDAITCTVDSFSKSNQAIKPAIVRKLFSYFRHHICQKKIWMQRLHDSILSQVKRM
jgi:hypothetical protein